MMIQLRVEQIADHWDIVKHAIEQSLPPIAGDESDGRMNRILSAALSGRLQCWISYEIEEDKLRKLNGIATTQILIDDVCDVKNLLIYSVFSAEEIGAYAWKEGLKTLTDYAISKGCKSLIAYTQIDGIIDLVNKLGGDTSFRFIKLPLIIGD